jgi:NitT/TauT family transport system substrate-binding protein
MNKYLMLVVVIALVITGCASEDITTVKIAEQYGLAYAPLTIAKELGLIEKHLSDDYAIKWEKMINTAGIREAMLSNNLDVGFMGIPPFLIGYDNQMDWKIFRGLNRAPLGLTYRTDKISSLDDIDQSHKIALPQPGSIQHILLTMYLDQQYGNPGFLDDYLLTMSHPDGEIALLSNSEIAAHFTSPPYIFDELKEANVELMVDSKTAFGGEFTFIVGVIRDGFENREIIEAINQGIDEAIVMIEKDPHGAIEILSAVYEMDPDQMSEYLYWEGMDFSNEVIGVETFIEFMEANDYLKNSFDEKDVYYEK